MSESLGRDSGSLPGSHAGDVVGSEPSADDREHTVRFGFGAGVSPRLHAAFESRFGFPLLEAWAMTETGAGAAVIANREPRKIGTACFGRPSAAASSFVSSTSRAQTRRQASTANCGSARRATARGLDSSASI